ncbi:MAG TPA: dihydrodipicolinate synthase family protein, partial [Dehalococcoidia bacterium]|nr:dihydrodipicolinate synthase family protein [Dehalococcoidia bacterium]
MLTAQDLRGVLAIPPTPSKEGAERWDATDTVDLDELSRGINQLIVDGVDGIITFGTTGECATLSTEDWQTAADCVLSVVNKRVPTFIGTTTLGVHETVKRLRFIRERGADGPILGLPMWQKFTLPMAVEYYATISEAFPDIAIMVYGNSNAFRFHYPVPFWKQVAERAPTVITAKFSNPAMHLALVHVTKNRIAFLPHVGQAYTQARIDPASTKACWSTDASMGPAPSIALMDAILAEDWERARQINAEMHWASETFFPPGGFEEFGSYNIQLEKIRFDAAGYMKAGPIRPPYNVVPEAYAEGARENGRRYAQLQQKYAAQVA